MQSTTWHRFSLLVIVGIVLVFVSATAATAQTTAFTYQGRLTDGATAATGTYQMQFGLFDVGGNQIGSTLTFDGVGGNPAAVQVSNGVFTVELEFGANPFAAGVARYLEIAVKKPADASYTTLTPRQQLTSSPYAIRTLTAGTADALSNSCVSCVTNDQIATVDGSKVTGTVGNATSATTATNADKLGNVAASQYVQTNDSRLTDARPASSIDFSSATLSGALLFNRGGTGLTASGASGNFLRSTGSGWTSAALAAADLPAGSGNYIRNTTTPQTGNFNITGSGTVGGALTANSVTASNSNLNVFSGTSSSNLGTWFRLNNTSTDGTTIFGRNWAIISTGNGNSEGPGKLIFNDQTSGVTRMMLGDTGMTLQGSATVTGDLTVNGTVNSNLPLCKALQVSTQPLPNLSILTLRLDATAFCSGVTFDNPNETLVIQKPGIYSVTAEILFANNGSGVRFLAIGTSNAIGEIVAYSTNAVGGVETVLNGTGLVRLNAGDTVFLIGGQSSGGTLSTSFFANRSAALSVIWIAP